VDIRRKGNQVWSREFFLQDSRAFYSCGEWRKEQMLFIVKVCGGDSMASTYAHANVFVSIQTIIYMFKSDLVYWSWWLMVGSLWAPCSNLPWLKQSVAFPLQSVPLTTGGVLRTLMLCISIWDVHPESYLHLCPSQALTLPRFPFSRPRKQDTRGRNGISPVQRTTTRNLI